MKLRYLWMLLVVLAACTDTTAPTLTPDIVRDPSVQPSAVILPVVPTDAADQSIGRSEPTSAAMAAEGHPSQDPASLSPPTEATVPLQFILNDGTVTQVLFYGAPTKPAPVVVLIPDETQRNTEWEVLAELLQNANYNVFAPSLPVRSDSQQALADIQVVYENIRLLSNIVTEQTILIGAGVGANTALSACNEMSFCLGVVAISPREGATPLVDKPLLLITADDDTVGTASVESLNAGDWQRYSNGGRGLQLLRSQSGIAERIAGWIQNHL